MADSMRRFLGLCAVISLFYTSSLRFVADKGSTFCFTDSNGAQSPTLQVNPGDRIVMETAA